MIDIWGSTRYHQGLRNKIEQKFKNRIDAGKIEINLGLSTDVVHQFEEHYFDWIYIDTAHTYNVTIAELNEYSKKMKLGGIIAGHDYVRRNRMGTVRYGVIGAVYEFCVKNDWEIIYITVENNGNPSFAIRKIQ